MIENYVTVQDPADPTTWNQVMSCQATLELANNGGLARVVKTQDEANWPIVPGPDQPCANPGGCLHTIIGEDAETGEFTTAQQHCAAIATVYSATDGINDDP